MNDLNINGLEVYSWSMLAQYLSCRKKFDWRYNQLLVPTGRSTALGFGTVFHAAMESWYSFKDYERAKRDMLDEADKCGLVETMEEHPKHSKERALKVFEQYVNTYKDDFTVEIVDNRPAIEVPFVVEINDISPSFLYVGTLDGIIRRNGALYGFEHKTTQRVDDAYLHSFRPNHQITGYCWGLSNYIEEPIGNFLVNIVHLLKNETKFLRINTTRTTYEVHDFKKQLIAMVTDIRKARLDEAWYMNTTNCSAYGGCPYRELCTANPEHVENFKAAAYEKELPRDLLFVNSLLSGREIT